MIIQIAQRKNAITDFRHLCDRELRYFDDPKFRLLMDEAILPAHKLGELSRNQLELFYQQADHLCAIAWPDLQKLLKFPDIKLSKLL